MKLQNPVGIILTDCQFRRACLMIPKFEMRQVNVIRIRHCGHEVVAGHSLPVMAGEIEPHTLLKTVFTKQGMHHADNFSALFINRRRIEVIDFDIAVRTDGMCQRAGIFRELGRTERPDRLDPLHRC